MRVERDWEDGIGNRLHDFEGELSPQAWQNINKRIKPRSYKRYYWLSAVLLFLALPTALYFSGSFENLEIYSGKVAHDSVENTESQQYASEKTVGISAPKPGYVEMKEVNSANQNGNISTTKTPEQLALASENAAQLNSNNAKPIQENEPDKALIAVSAATGSRPATLIANEENQQTETLETGHKPVRNIHKYAESKVPGKVAITNSTDSERLPKSDGKDQAAQNGKKTVGFLPEKPDTKTGKHNEYQTIAVSSVDKNIMGLPSGANEIHTLAARNTILIPEFLMKNFPETLPDTIKEQLIAIKPAPKNLAEKPVKKQKKQTAHNWAFSVYGSPQYTFQRVLPNKQDSRSVIQMDNQNSFETERLGYELGFRAHYRLKNNLALNIGVQASQQNQILRLQTTGVKPDSVVVTQQSNSISMQIYNKTVQETHTYQFVFGGLYTGLQMGISEKLDMHGGLGMNWLIQTRTSNEIETVQTRKFNPFLSMGLQYKQQIGTKLTFTAGPAMQYYLQAVQEKQVLVGVKPTTLGFNFGLQYKP